ncbi:hypothetical protein H6G64_27800 [Calothrix sp. FACHB-156]|nr:hypothetical protein [Nostoc linckia FACHB-104]MBD2340776.1 hypothetical protein [Calothrix sp. FACHB-156]
MEETNQNNFIYSWQRYHGHFKPEALVFNANLQEFATRVSYICNLQTNGKISPDNAYQQINALWEQLERSHLLLGIDKDI